MHKYAYHICMQILPYVDISDISSDNEVSFIVFYIAQSWQPVSYTGIEGKGSHIQ